MEEKKSFGELIANPDKAVLVDFYATWCGPCQALSPIVQELAREMSDKVQVIKIDVDKNPAVSQRFKIRGVPTLILFKGGEIKWQQAGVMPKRDLKAVIERFA
jgi:thioredoxin 1